MHGASMLISELLSQLSKLAARHGDLEIFFDFDSVLTKTASVELLSGPYEDLPAFVISLPQEDAVVAPPPPSLGRAVTDMTEVGQNQPIKDRL
jgi:hypothetical protein